MKEWLPLLVTVLCSVLGSGLFLTLLQRRWAKSDNKVAGEVVGTQSILDDGKNIRHELWKEIGLVRGELKSLQSNQAAGLEERYQLKLAIKGLEKTEAQCKEELEDLRARVTATEAQHG